jgi:ketosteroid isomerase-like protein
MTTTAAHPLIEAVGRALDAGDPAGLADLYAPDAVWLAVDAANPPGSPRRLTGPELRARVRGIPPDVEMSLEDAMVGADGRVSMFTLCRFPDGTAALAAHVFTLDDDGRIVSHRSVEASG